MKKCNDCKYAEWEETKTGRLHPSGDGYCTFKIKYAEIPSAFYWFPTEQPRACGGGISRKQELKEHCKMYDKEKT